MSKKRQIRGTRATQARRAKTSPAVTPIDGPTPEQAERVVYERGPVRDEDGRTLAMAYRREPIFETMAKKGTIAPDELEALRYYRGAFDRSERSATKSCLNITQGGGMGGMPAELANATASMIDAKRRIVLCESVLGAHLTTMRAIALHDRSISDVAIERFGARPQSWILINEPVLENGRPVVVNGKPVTRAAHREKIVPRSGRHRAIVAAEFKAGLAALTRRLWSHSNMKDVVELWIEPLDDGRACVSSGRCAPQGRYRWWGGGNDIADVVQWIRRNQPGGMIFTTAQAARRIVERGIKTQKVHLHELEPDELAA